MTENDLILTNRINKQLIRKNKVVYFATKSVASQKGVVPCNASRKRWLLFLKK